MAHIRTLIGSADKLQSFLIFLSIGSPSAIGCTQNFHITIFISQNVRHCSSRGYCRICKHEVREEDNILLNQIKSNQTDCIS